MFLSSHVEKYMLWSSLANPCPKQKHIYLLYPLVLVLCLPGCRVAELQGAELLGGLRHASLLRSGCDEAELKKQTCVQKHGLGSCEGSSEQLLQAQSSF